MNIRVKDAYDQGVTQDLYASVNGSKITAIRSLKNGWFLLKSPAFTDKHGGYRVRGNYQLWLNDGVQTVAVPKPTARKPRSDHRSRAWVLTEKGYRACKQMELAGERFEFPIAEGVL